MPIRAELRGFYGREWREVTRPRILKRAGDECEQCGAPNNTTTWRVRGCWLFVGVQWRSGPTLVWLDETSRVIDEPDGLRRLVRIVLTIAHLNHIAGDDRDENLKALCQWCHLNYDKLHHKESREARKDAARPLLAEVSPG